MTSSKPGPMELSVEFVLAIRRPCVTLRVLDVWLFENLIETVMRPWQMVRCPQGPATTPLGAVRLTHLPRSCAH